MMDRMIFLVIGLCLAMGVQAAPELVQEPVAKAPQYNVSMNHAESDVLFHKPAAVKVNIPSFKGTPTMVSVGAPLNQTSAVVVRSSAITSQGSSNGAVITVGSTSVSATTSTVGIILPRVTPLNTRTSFASRQFISADEYLEQHTTKRAAPPPPPIGTNPDDKKLPLTTTIGDIYLLLGLCGLYLLWVGQRKRLSL